MAVIYFAKKLDVDARWIKDCRWRGNKGSDIKKRHNMKVEISLSSVFWALIFSFGSNLAAFRMTSAISIKLSGFVFFSETKQ